MATHAESRLAPPRPPQLPERYQPIRRIAAGGSATVWCVEDNLLGRRVAVKLLADPYASDPTAVRRFKREARAAARLSGHPHVITIFDVSETEPDELGHVRPFIVMEHLSGGTVADALRVGEASLDDAVRWLHEAASALDYAHVRGVLHRDIKPANLLLNPRRALHVADFGIAQMGTEDTMTSPGHVLGTAGYLAPERALGRPATVATDLYALAVAAFELLTGERPFNATSYIAQARQHLEAPPPRASEHNPQLPGAIDAVLARGMAKVPEQRWPSAETFAVAVERALAPTLSPAAGRVAAMTRAQRVVETRRAAASGVALAPAAAGHPVAPARRTSRSRQRRPWGTRPRLGRPVVLGAVAAALVAIAVVAFAWAGNGGTRSPLRRSQASAHAATPASARPAVHLSAAAKAKPASRTPPTQAAAAAAPAASPAATPVSTAGTLEAQGHALLNGGSYSAAISLLRRAMANAAPSSLTYAYAMYDLGQALTMAGNPTAGAAVLQQRLQIPNQTDVVRRALKRAQEAAAARTPAPRGGAPAAPAPGETPVHGAGRAKAGRHHGPYALPPGTPSGPPPMVPGAPDPSAD